MLMKNEEVNESTVMEKGLDMFIPVDIYNKDNACGW